MRRPAQLVYAMDEAPPPGLATALAFQLLAIQSITFVIPVAIAGALGASPAAEARFLGLSILATLLWQVLQLLPRGTAGSGYPVPGTHSAAFLGAYPTRRRSVAACWRMPLG